jgi:hypothetical protein
MRSGPGEKENKMLQKKQKAYSQESKGICASSHNPDHYIHYIRAPLILSCFFFLSIESRSIPIRFIVRTMQEGNRSVDQERLW